MNAVSQKSKLQVVATNFSLPGYELSVRDCASPVLQVFCSAAPDIESFMAALIGLDSSLEDVSVYFSGLDCGYGAYKVDGTRYGYWESPKNPVVYTHQVTLS